MTLPSGYWRRMSPNFPGDPEFMEVVPGLGRVLCSTVVPEFPAKRAPIAVMYEDAGAGAVRVRIRPQEAWQIHHYRLEDDFIVWNHGGADYRWDKIEESDLPDWWPEFRARAWSRMDRRRREVDDEFKGEP